QEDGAPHLSSGGKRHTQGGAHVTKRRQRAGLLGAAGVSSMMGAGAVGTLAQDQVEFSVYDLHNLDPGMTFIKQTVDAYMAAHPNVKINLTVLENTALKEKISAEMQSGNPPDLFQSWGGGTLAQQ